MVDENKIPAWFSQLAAFKQTKILFFSFLLSFFPPNYRTSRDKLICFALIHVYNPNWRQVEYSCLAHPWAGLVPTKLGMPGRIFFQMRETWFPKWSNSRWTHTCLLKFPQSVVDYSGKRNGRLVNFLVSRRWDEQKTKIIF